MDTGLGEHPGIADRYERVLDPATEDALRSVFRQFNRAMVLMWRLGLVRTADIWPGGFGRLMVVEHRGRRTGATYRSPLNFARFEGDVYCLAAFGEKTDWFQNAVAAGEVTLWMPDGVWQAHMESAAEHPQRLSILRLVLIASGFAARLFGLNPTILSDADLDAATATNLLVRVELVDQGPAQSGHPDLAWVWPVLGGAIVAVGAIIWALKPRRKLQPRQETGAGPAKGCRCD